MGGEERGEKCGVVQPKGIEGFQHVGMRGDGEKGVPDRWGAAGRIGAGWADRGWDLLGDGGERWAQCPPLILRWVDFAELKQWDGKRWELGSVAASHPRTR